MTEKRALEDKNHDHCRYWGIGKMLCSDTFWTYLVVRLCFDWIQSFPLKPVLIEFEAAVVSQQSTFPTAFCPTRRPWKRRTSRIVFNNFSKARVEDVLSRWNSTSKKQKSRKKKPKQFNTKWRKSCYWYWRCLQWVTDHPFTDWKWKRHNFNL